MPLSRHNVGTYQETSSHATRQGNTPPQWSQLAEPLWTDPDLKSEISMRRQGMNGGTISQNPRQRGKSHHQQLPNRQNQL